MLRAVECGFGMGRTIHQAAPGSGKVRHGVVCNIPGRNAGSRRLAVRVPKPRAAARLAGRPVGRARAFERVARRYGLFVRPFQPTHRS
ncbi:hypothetical protein GCM10007854_08120 [Algimonas porphyrae]|uniref:Uncharacterized protein n=1 Tax=Algimonas porphyrae TaxID=1128113 RepID=A0ABQ5UYD0_9PROT|nr:hypothetical protein GCM10007854_08120 [Algimonas porphyrae]